MSVMGQIFVLFMLIMIGFAIRKLGIVSSAMNKEVSSFVLNVALPAMLISSMDFPFSMEVLIDSGLLIVISFAVYGVSILLSKLYSRVMGNTGKARDVMEYVIVFSNCGYMGYPVVREIFGEKGVFYAALYNLSFSILIWSYGVYLLKSDDAVKKISIRARLKRVVSPGLVAIVIGYFMFLTGLSFPEPVKVILEMLGDTTTPLSMMFIGFILTEVKFKEAMQNTQVWWISLLRLVVIPVLTFTALTLIGFKGLTLYVPVIISAMPAAANTAIFASQFNSDYKLGSLLIFATTLLSLGTIPILMLFIR